ncbi:cytochrome P450 2B1-like [Ambystoma mexicanum]|uniref:cytochrome P450 2B1-like n=1 Tax=Ambystoma mexicanum TaxID=8296 RepID=UPI0037E7E082
MAALAWMECPKVSSVLLAVAVLILVLELRRLWLPSKRRPPGPAPLPFLGNVFSDRDNVEFMIHMQKKYGDMSTIFLGRTPIILLNSYQVVKEALVQSALEFASRPSIPVLEWILHGLGILMAPYGPSWKQQRRFALTTLRNFGLGKRSTEARISEEAEFLIRSFQEAAGQPFDPQFKVTNAVSNIICSLVFGNRFDYTNAEFQYLLDLISKNIRLTGSMSALMVNVCPFLRHFPGPHQQIKNNATQVFKFIDKAVQEHRQTLDAENPRDYIDAYLLEMEKQNSNPDSTFSSENLQACIADLFVAGTDTTSTTLRWGLLYMITYPDIQAQCQQEIEQVVGWDRLPAWDDRLKMPYVEATIHEIMRFASITAFGVFRQVTKDTALRGYPLSKAGVFYTNYADDKQILLQLSEDYKQYAVNINKIYDIIQRWMAFIGLALNDAKKELLIGTTVMVNYAAIFFDPSMWKDPKHFNPQNFLDEKGRFMKPECMIPFGAGQRQCPGEQLVQMELFIFFTSLLQNLDLGVADKEHIPDFSYTAQETLQSSSADGSGLIDLGPDPDLRTIDSSRN